MLRKMDNEEANKYGCKYCNDAKRRKRRSNSNLMRMYWCCPYEKCPYKEINQAGSFKRYLKDDKYKMQFEILEGGVASEGDRYA